MRPATWGRERPGRCDVITRAAGRAERELLEASDGALGAKGYVGGGGVSHRDRCTGGCCCAVGDAKGGFPVPPNGRSTLSRRSHLRVCSYILKMKSL